MKCWESWIMQLGRMDLSYFFLHSTLVQVMCCYRKAFNESLMFLEEWVTPICIISIIKWSLKSAVQSHTHITINISVIILHIMSLQSQPACEYMYASFPTIYILEKIFQNSTSSNSDIILKALLLRMSYPLVHWQHLWLSHPNTAYSP